MQSGSSDDDREMPFLEPVEGLVSDAEGRGDRPPPELELVEANARRRANINPQERFERQYETDADFREWCLMRFAPARRSPAAAAAREGGVVDSPMYLRSQVGESVRAGPAPEEPKVRRSHHYARPYDRETDEELSPVHSRRHSYFSPSKSIRKSSRRLSHTPDRGVGPPHRGFLRPPKFDGRSGFVESHLMQFDIAALRNRWDESEKIDYLKCSLTGDAAHILRDLPPEASWTEVVERLRQRYGSLDQVEAYRAQLKNRRRAPGKSLSDLLKDIRRLFLGGFPGPSNYMSDIAAKDAFINAVNDKELMIKIMEREPKTLDEAFKIAERLELYRSIPSEAREDQKHCENHAANRVVKHDEVAKK